MFELHGKYNSAKIFSDTLDNEAARQIIALLNSPVAIDSTIRIMPDYHAGKGCVIGTTMTVIDKVCPNLVGVDIGCGMLVAYLGRDEIDLENLDNIIRKNIPVGFSIRNKAVEEFTELNNLEAEGLDITRARLSIGTLGGGNHFIEVNKTTDGNLYLVIHTGSRNIGKQVAEYWQNVAIKNSGYNPKELAYLEGSAMQSYLHDLEICQRYASLNRKVIADIISDKLSNLHYLRQETIHNYISDGILRKGAIDASKGKHLIIPINMRDGSILGIGLGNEDYNFSAPHGAGRLMSRSKAKENISMDDFRESMTGIYSTSISESTLDESPFAYKPMQEILDNTVETVSVTHIIKPIYNLKDSKKVKDED